MDDEDVLGRWVAERAGPRLVAAVRFQGRVLDEVGVNYDELTEREALLLDAALGAAQRMVLEATP